MIQYNKTQIQKYIHKLKTNNALSFDTNTSAFFTLGLTLRSNYLKFMFIKPKCYRYDAKKTITIYNINMRTIDGQVSTCSRADNKKQLKIELNDGTASTDNQI